MKINKCYLQQFQHHECRYYYEIGSRWSGKTFSVIQNNVIESINKPGLITVAARKTYASIRDSIFADYLNVLSSSNIPKGLYTATVSPLAITFSNGSKVIFKGADNPEKIKGLSGIHRLILDELNEFTEQDFETFDLSIRGRKYDHKIFMCHNPVPIVPGDQYWFQRLFDPGTLQSGKPIVHHVKGLGDVSAMKTTYKQNAFVPDQVVSKLEGYKYTNPQLYKLWALGEYTQIQGAIYTNWDVVKSVPSGVDFWGYGLDFGFSNDPAALLKIWGTKTDIYIEGSLYRTGLTNRDLLDEMRKIKVDAYDTIIADSAEPKSIEEIYRGGFKGIKGVKKAANYKIDTIKVIQGYKIHIIEGDINLQREISTYAYQRDKEDRQLPKPQDGNDHYMDCLTMFMRNKKGSARVSISGRF
jgi:phage terminase large subunit